MKREKRREEREEKRKGGRETNSDPSNKCFAPQPKATALNSSPIIINHYHFVIRTHSTH